MHILLADNDAEFLEIVQYYFSTCGHRARIATSGLACIALLRDSVPDVLVLDRDLFWGGSDGVLVEMARDSLLSRLPVILTVNISVGDEIVALPRWPVTCLFKPYRLSELLKHAHTLMRLRSNQISFGGVASICKMHFDQAKVTLCGKTSAPKQSERTARAWGFEAPVSCVEEPRPSACSADANAKVCPCESRPRSNGARLPEGARRG